MSDRIRPLTAHEEYAIRAADYLRLTLERLRDNPPGDQADRECVVDALGWLDNVDRCLRDIAIVDKPEED